MRNAVAVVLTIAMLGMAAMLAVDVATMLGARPQLTAPGPDSAENADRERIAAAFYAAANAVLNDEAPEMLTGIVSPEVVTHASDGGSWRGPEALAQRLAGRRQQAGMRIDLVRIVDNGSEIAAFIEARAPFDVAGAAERGALLWRTIDLIRIERGMIADYWPGAPGQPAPLPLAAATVPAKPGDTGVSLTRLVLGPDVDALNLDASAPHLLLIESGAMVATRETELLIARAGQRAFSPLPAAPGMETILRPGDALLMPTGTGPTIRDAQDAVASALSLLIAPRARLYSQVQALPTDVVTVMGMHDPWRAGSELTWDSGATTETLAVGMLEGGGWPEGAVVLHGEPLVVDPGQSLPPRPPGVMQLAIVRAGVASVASSGERVESSPAGAPRTPNPEEERLVWAGDAFTIDSSASPRITNPGSTRLDILIVEITPAVGESTPSPRPACGTLTC